MSEIPEIWPKNIKAAVNQLLIELPIEQKNKIVSYSEEELINLHFGMGTYIRNEFGLWHGNKDLLRECGKEDMHPDDASMVIIKALWKMLKEKEKK